MVLKLPEGEKQLFWGFKCDTFHIFVNFWGTKLKLFSGKANQNLQNGFILKFARGGILEIGFEVTLKSKTNALRVSKWFFYFFCRFFSEQVEKFFKQSKEKDKKLCKSEVGHRKDFRKWFWNYLEVKSRCTTEPLKKGNFQFFAHFQAMKLKPLTVKARQNVQKSFNPKLVMVSISENDFEETRQNPNVLSLWKEHFYDFCKFLSDEVEIISRESEGRHQILLKSKFDHKKLIIKLFCSYLHLKNECFERFKIAFFSFFQVFIEEVENASWESKAKS